MVGLKMGLSINKSKIMILTNIKNLGAIYLDEEIVKIVTEYKNI